MVIFESTLIKKKTKFNVFSKTNPSLKYVCFSFNFNSAFKADKMNSKWRIKIAKCIAIRDQYQCVWLKYSAMEGTDRCVYAKNAVPWEAQTGVFTLRM